MKTIILAIEDIRAIVRYVGADALMDKMIERLASALKNFDGNETVIPARAGFSYQRPNMGLIEWMPIMKTGEKATVKIVGYHPSNPILRNLPTILSTVSTYDTETGHLIGITDGVFLTALRTGAASAVASQIMASPQTKTLGLIGCGAQAITQLHAISRIFELEKVLIYDIDPAVSRSFITRAAFMNLDIETASLASLVRAADVICTATSVEVGKGPVFEENELKPWVHINAVGSDFPGKIEIPIAQLKKSFVCPDFLEQALKEGECQQLTSEDIAPDLVEIVKNEEKYEFVKTQPSVFDSTGWAFEDQIAMEMLLQYAHELERGTEVQIESVADDPRNPYWFVSNDKQARRTAQKKTGFPDFAEPANVGSYLDTKEETELIESIEYATC